jgi:hypothetical protein
MVARNARWRIFPSCPEPYVSTFLLEAALAAARSAAQNLPFSSCGDGIWIKLLIQMKVSIILMIRFHADI